MRLQSYDFFRQYQQKKIEKCIFRRRHPKGDNFFTYKTICLCFKKIFSNVAYTLGRFQQLFAYVLGSFQDKLPMF